MLLKDYLDSLCHIWLVLMTLLRHFKLFPFHKCIKAFFVYKPKRSRHAICLVRVMQKLKQKFHHISIYCVLPRLGIESYYN